MNSDSQIPVTALKRPFALTRDVLISDIVNESLRAVELLAEYGITCINCAFNQFDSLTSGAVIHGMNDEELDNMITEINSQLETESARNV